MKGESFLLLKKYKKSIGKNKVVGAFLRTALPTALLGLSKSLFLLDVIVTQKSIIVNSDPMLFAKILGAFVLLSLVSLFTKEIFPRKDSFKKAMTENYIGAPLGVIL